MLILKRTLVVQLCFIAALQLLMAEGTRQIMPASVSKGQLCIDYSRNSFAFYDGAEEFRLNITIADTSEEIRFGFGDVEGNYKDDLVFRIKDPSGNVVFGPLPVPTSGSGYIHNWDEAYAGPFPSSGGYDFLSITPSSSGNYYLEFYYPPYPSGGYDHENKHLLQFFDITVTDKDENGVNGRVWSEGWQFWCENPASPPTDNRFYGKMMVLSNDSIVTGINCNGLIGGSFSLSSNMTGCANTGDLMVDRKSRSGFFTYPQYKIFLNDPDSTLFPTARVKSGIIEPVTVSTDCATGTVRFGVRVVKDGTVELLIESNLADGSDPEDVQIVTAVSANPGGNGYNEITWNGNDNYGNPVPSGTTVRLTVSYLSGLTQLPMYDIENNDRGFIIEQIRPPGGHLDVFWDDTNLPGGTFDTVNGCNDIGGCHTWDNKMGDNNTINTWWFVVREDVPPVSFVMARSPGALNLHGQDVYCTGTANPFYTVDAEPNTSEYIWSYSGSGVTVNSSGTTAELIFASNATDGTLSVKGYNAECGEGPESGISIDVIVSPVVSLADLGEMCYTAPGFKLEGGSPEGGTYYVDGYEADSLYPYLEPAGVHQVVYIYSSLAGCPSSDTAEVFLYTGPECEGSIFFPNAFTPNGDGLNEVFRPVYEGILRYSLFVYSRWGQEIFRTSDPEEGWDGTLNGNACPGDVYVFVSSFGLSLRPEDNGVRKGTVTLLR
jgi:gliding motility-associated-like protein